MVVYSLGAVAGRRASERSTLQQHGECSAPREQILLPITPEPYHAQLHAGFGSVHATGILYI